VAAAVSYGVTIICNRELATRGFGPASSLSVRFGTAGALLLALLVVGRRPLLPAAGERWRALSLGLVGYAFESVLFYSALERGSAAAVALLFYSYPAMVAVVELATGRVRLAGRVATALALSVVGAVLVVSAGEEVTITVAGIAFALAAAASFTVYLLASARATPRTEALTNGAWVAVGASLSIVVFGALGGGGGLEAPGPSWWLMLVNGAATAAAFTLLFAAVRRMGASRTAIVMTMEAVSAVVLGAVLLGERLGPRQALGGGAIVAATLLVGRARASGAQPAAAAA
jgi:drug/metabolite transporter (DMT)-like permease